MLNKYLFPLIPLLLSGCAPNIKVSPNQLPDAYLNQPYVANVEITNGTVSDMTFYTKLSNNSFEISTGVRESGQDDYNNLTINGLPTSLEPISVNIAGSTYGTNYPGKEFEKEYMIEVKVAE